MHIKKKFNHKEKENRLFSCSSDIFTNKRILNFQDFFNQSYYQTKLVPFLSSDILKRPHKFEKNLCFEVNK